jgi:uncharacterized lipoprotein YajG
MKTPRPILAAALSTLFLAGCDGASSTAPPASAAPDASQNPLAKGMLDDMKAHRDGKAAKP